MSGFLQPRGAVVVASTPARNPDPVEFNATVAGRVRLISVLCFAVPGILAVVGAVLPIVLRNPPHPSWVLVAVPLAIMAVMFPIALFSQVFGYRLTRDHLIVRRRGRENRLALAGLRSVEVDPAATAWSIKTFGNDGLGAMTGRFRNRKLGAYRAFVTNRANSVVLRWTDVCVVVSPDRPEDFAAEIRARTGLKA